MLRKLPWGLVAGVLLASRVPGRADQVLARLTLSAGMLPCTGSPTPRGRCCTERQLDFSEGSTGSAAVNGPFFFHERGAVIQ